MKQTNPQAPAPFSCSFTPNVPELLTQLQCTIAVTTYQANKVVFISPKDENYLVQLPRTFEKPMGLALRGKKMAIATKHEVMVMANEPELGTFYPKQPNTYDSFFVPRASYYTGFIDIHDLDWGNDGLYAVNTSFSCIAKVDDNYSFTPVWKPPFISKLASEDRCHLNGMAMENGKPKYVTSFNQGDSFQSWREEITTAGTLIDVETNEFLARQLPMPHSPRLFDGELYVLLSATGELAHIDRQTGQWRSVIKLGGFVRGLAKHQDYLFIGLSKLRKNSSTFAHLPIADQAKQAGIVIVHLPTATKVGEIIYQASLDEIYDVQVIPQAIRPGILNTVREDYQHCLATPQNTFWAKPQPETE